MSVHQHKTSTIGPLTEHLLSPAAPEPAGQHCRCVALLSQLGARHRGGEKVRVLLLARSAGTWWRRVRRDHLEETAESAVHRELDPRLEAPHAELTRASQAFASRIALLQSARVDQGWQPLAPQPAERSSGPLQAAGDSMVDVHLTALAGVLSAPDTAGGTWKRPVDVLIKHEQRYWQRVAQDRGLDGLFAKEEGLLPMLVALQRISGARTEKEGRGAVAAGLEVHHRHTTPTAAALAGNAAIETMLAALYPAPSGSSARWGAMTPDVLAAELIAEVDRDTSHAFLEQVLPHPRLSEAQRSHSMTIVVRVAATQPDVERSARPPLLPTPVSSCPWPPTRSPARRPLTPPEHGSPDCKRPSQPRVRRPVLTPTLAPGPSRPLMRRWPTWMPTWTRRPLASHRITSALHRTTPPGKTSPAPPEIREADQRATTIFGRMASPVAGGGRRPAGCPSWGCCT